MCEYGGGLHLDGLASCLACRGCYTESRFTKKARETFVELHQDGQLVWYSDQFSQHADGDVHLPVILHRTTVMRRFWFYVLKFDMILNINRNTVAGALVLRPHIASAILSGVTKLGVTWIPVW